MIATQCSNACVANPAVALVGPTCFVCPDPGALVAQSQPAPETKPAPTQQTEQKPAAS